MPRPARSEAPEDPTRLPLTRAAWADAVAALAAAEQAADRERLDPATWLAGIMALAGSEHAEPARLDLVRGPDFRAFARGAAESGLDRSAA